MDEKLIVENPATNNPFRKLDFMDRDAVMEKIRKADRAFREWRGTSVLERVALTERFLKLLRAEKERIAAEVTGQMGKPVSQARCEVDGCYMRASYMASVAGECLRDLEVARDKNAYRKIASEPRGVILDIASWNYPLQVAISAIAPAVLAGNSVIIKHSSYTPLCGLMFERLYREAGAPDGLVSAVVTDRVRSMALFESNLIKAVFFTGSVEGGYQVNRQASGLLVDVGLELGGKDPAYVREDADLETAVPALADASFYNTGQSCCAVERIYVHKKLYNEFIERFVAEVRGYKLGDPTAADTFIGPLTQRKQLKVLETQCEEATVRGAKILLGGGRAAVNGKGNYFEPTVIVDVTNDMIVMQEESFGPIIGIMSVDGDEEAVKLMNDSRFGLSASVWTRDLDIALALAVKIEAGTVLLNKADAVSPDLAWTGVKESGKGCTLSVLGFKNMVQPKSYNFAF